MKTKLNPRVDAYIATSAGFAQPILQHLRRLVHQACPEVEETIKWGFPSFVHHGILCNLAAFKAHCTFGFWHRGMARVVAPNDEKLDSAMGYFGRITSVADLPDDKVLLRYIREAAKLNESGAPARLRPRSGRKPEAKVPPDLAAALKKNKKAAAAFEQFSPSHRREYVEWIAEAKRDETRQKRVETTVAWLKSGKSRNWKYENC